MLMPLGCTGGSAARCRAPRIHDLHHFHHLHRLAKLRPTSQIHVRRTTSVEACSRSWAPFYLYMLATASRPGRYSQGMAYGVAPISAMRTRQVIGALWVPISRSPLPCSSCSDAAVMTDKQPLPIGLWVLALGASGFAAGFFGPMILRPDANQGPMMGIFITGPGGAALGLILGAIFRFAPISNARRLQTLAAVSTVFALGILFFCLPPPEIQALLLQGSVVKCKQPSELSSAAVATWEKRVANAPWANVRAGWQQEVPQMLRANSGVALTIQVQRENRIRKHRKPWNNGRLDAEGWNNQTSTRAYFADFAGSECSDYRGPLPMLQMSTGQHSNAWPPDDLPNLLDLARVGVASPRFAQLAK
jgi:hypothetical protein